MKAMASVVDGSDQVFICGNTASDAGITTANVYQPIYGGGMSDGLLAKFAPCEVPYLTMHNPATLCQPTTYLLDLTIQGTMPYTIYYSIDGISQTPIYTTFDTLHPVFNDAIWKDSITIDSIYSGLLQGSTSFCKQYRENSSTRNF